jgi:hypothetical protein
MTQPQNQSSSHIPRIIPALKPPTPITVEKSHTQWVRKHEDIKMKTDDNSTSPQRTVKHLDHFEGTTPNPASISPSQVTSKRPSMFATTDKHSRNFGSGKKGKLTPPPIKDSNFDGKSQRENQKRRD